MAFACKSQPYTPSKWSRFVNTPPRPDKAAPQPAHVPDDAYDDTYAWVGYESAQPLSFSGADQEVWPGTGEHRPD